MMGKKGGKGVAGDASSEMESLRSQLENVESLLQDQSKESQEFKA
jgi:hypothetical protein